jgi:hypothetical protein
LSCSCFSPLRFYAQTAPSPKEVDGFCIFRQSGNSGFYFSLGGADPGKFAQAKASGTVLPSNHSLFFAPEVDPALRAGIETEVAVLRNLLNTST